jgi:hypothetical protein
VIPAACPLRVRLSDRPNRLTGVRSFTRRSLARSNGNRQRKPASSVGLGITVPGGAAPRARPPQRSASEPVSRRPRATTPWTKETPWPSVVARCGIRSPTHFANCHCQGIPFDPGPGARRLGPTGRGIWRAHHLGQLDADDLSGFAAAEAVGPLAHVDELEALARWPRGTPQGTDPPSSCRARDLSRAAAYPRTLSLPEAAPQACPLNSRDRTFTQRAYRTGVATP